AALRRLGVEVFEAANERRRPPAGGGIGSVRNLLADRRWLTHSLPQFAADIGADVVHHPLPAIANQPPCPQVVTVHDLAFETHPEHFDRRFARFARHAHRRAAQEAAVVICVSQTTANDVMEHWQIPEARIVIAHHGPGQELPDVETEPLKHVLYVGDDEPRKNLALLRAARLPMPLCHAGLGGEPADPPALARLYAQALVLVHPSVHEGFGLTPLEAMGAGVPVVAVRNPAVVEVCGDAAIYVDAEDPGQLEQAVARLHDEPSHRAAVVAKGRERAALFSWEASARAHLVAYERALRK
ncbi:MAG: glycosyl transferase group 1, partial [Acidimicrobiales bacterium]|nr:glycosyl transferase group 1 [Acidimicrobiales bacterium]